MDLITNIAENVHDVIALAVDGDTQAVKDNKKVVKYVLFNICVLHKLILYVNSMTRYKWLLKKNCRRQWHGNMHWLQKKKDSSCDFGEKYDTRGCNGSVYTKNDYG